VGVAHAETVRRPGTPHRWQVEDLAGLPSGPRYEIVDGGLLTMPPPGLLHQWLCRRLFLQLAAQTPPGWETALDIGVLLGRTPGDTDLRVPDLAILRGGGRPSPEALAVPAAVVALVLEVTVTTVKQDRILKPLEYAEAGIPWFWRLEVEPEIELVTHALRSDHYAETGRHSRSTVTLDGPFPVDLNLEALGREPPDASSGPATR